MKIYRPDLYYSSPLSDFEKHIIETGNEVELVARKLFPTGVLIEGRDASAQKKTSDLIAQKQSILFQPIFVKDGFLAAVDILKYDKTTDSYSIYEVKASNEVDKKVHLHDLAFQVILLRTWGLRVSGMNLICLNKDYVRSGDLQIVDLFNINDVQEDIEQMLVEVKEDMQKAKAYLAQKKEPPGECCCIYKGRSSHCTTFPYSNPTVPPYSVHDISRIGTSKKKLANLIDSRSFHLHEVNGQVELNEAQQNQVDAHVLDRTTIQKDKIAEEFQKLQYPLYFLDYETFPSAIPLFDGYSPYDQIPFQYSLHILESPESDVTSYCFLHTGTSDPSIPLAESLESHVGPRGSVIVWYKPFEKTRNTEIGIRLPHTRSFFESVNSRIFDLMEIFTKQYYVHKDFKGSCSIKKVLPVLVPELSYKDLEIQEGGTASQTWKKVMDGAYSESETQVVIENLKKYCDRDTHAMYAIWRVLQGL
jgi:hypothetical protein